MPVYDLQAMGCVLDGNPSKAAANTQIFQNAIQQAKSAPGPIYLGMGGPLAVLNGQLDLNAPGMVLKGDGSMGANPLWGATSSIKGIGAGDTLKISQGGCKVQGIAWTGDGQQSGDNAFIKVVETQATLADIYMNTPNIGISVQAKAGSLVGQSWIENVLMEGYLKHAALDINNLGGATRLSHVRVFNGVMDPADPQPPYGVLVRSAGELMIDSCDIDNCGINLAIVPGIDNVQDTYVQNLSIVNSDFDNGNGEGQILIRPYGTSFILNSQMANVWCSTVNNGSATWPANGLTIDGTHSHPRAGFPSICNVSLANSVFQNAVGHCGVYANDVQGLSIVGCGAWNNFNGFQTFSCNGVIAHCKAGAYHPTAVGSPHPGNVAYGILLERSKMAFNPAENALDGNGQPPGWIILP